MKPRIATYAAMLLATTCLAASGAGSATKPAERRDGDRLAAGTAARAQAQAPADIYKLTDWDDLVPKDWNPMKAMEGLKVQGLALMGDADPQAMRALDALKEAWDHAPAEPSMNNARIRIPGFVVPLDGVGGAVHELLLVPYFGACIHTPPPPANQVIHVTLKTPIKGLRMMDAIWVSGQLYANSSQTEMGMASYTMDAVAVAPYKEPR